MSPESPLITQVALTMLPKLNSFRYQPLFQQCGGIGNFFSESEKNICLLLKDFNIPTGLPDRKTALDKAAKELTEMDRHNIQICTIEHTGYPNLLAQCEDAPLVFFYKGNIPTETSGPALAIVGTRHASPRCQARVEMILQELCGMGHHPVIISGLAFGIDASAHRASLKLNLRTYAVLGHGLHMVYPASHKELAEKILQSGGTLISEFPCCAEIHPSNFLQRNRIVAGLSQATFIAESAEKGGAMTTARIALSYSRDVMALPGRPEDSWSAGCNRLIKENVAALVENGTDVAQILGLPCEKKRQPIQTTFDFFGSSETGNESVILNLLADRGEMNIDELCVCSGISSSELSALLLKLELEGKLLPMPGKTYTIA